MPRCWNRSRTHLQAHILLNSLKELEKEVIKCQQRPWNHCLKISRYPRGQERPCVTLGQGSIAHGGAVAGLWPGGATGGGDRSGQQARGGAAMPGGLQLRRHPPTRFWSPAELAAVQLRRENIYLHGILHFFHHTTEAHLWWIQTSPLAHIFFQSNANCFTLLSLC